LDNSNGELKLRLFLSPWGELKDVYVSESSGNNELDEMCLKAVWIHDRYQPFPEELGDIDLWIDIPIIFEVREEKRKVEAEHRLLADKEEIKPAPPLLIGDSVIDDAVDIALENHMALKIAEEEIELSRLKIREATRALYPAASLNYLETTGKTTELTQDFTDKEYKLKFEYPLYYGWRLKYAVEQAISNMKAVSHSYNKVEQDLRLEVELAFYSYLVAKANVRLQRSLLEEVQKIFDRAKKRFDIGLSTKAEYLQVESQLKQINYQVASEENDLALARLALAQAMNVEDKDIEDILGISSGLDTIKMLEPAEIDITLEQCMDLAFRTRPDLKSKEYMVEFNGYERKIALSKDQVRVDLIGTYGKSGGAYESESLSMGKDWYMGFKVSKPLGGSTLSSAYTKDETSQKHGQSTRTESVSNSLEFGILDSLQSFSEKKSADIGLKKAENELQETKDAIFKEVEDAYFGYKKGLLQAESNLNKIRYREEELKVAKARVELNDIPLSELIQAHMSLTDEHSYYIEAIGSLYQSLAKLNEATGYSLFLDEGGFRLARSNEDVIYGANVVNEHKSLSEFDP
jgi:outer membrane protein